MPARGRQGALNFRSWGGRRAGAGRKPTGTRPAVPHRRRPQHDRHHPLHVTLRAVRGLPSLRAARVFALLRRALAAGSKPAFRVAQFSVQGTHVHLLVEADTGTALTRGLQGLGIRLAKAVNRALQRGGSVWAERYHARALRTPREVRHALVYVLMNWRKHGARGAGLDPCSSAPWFGGWRTRLRAVVGAAPIATARTWLLAVGWRRWGPIDVREAPAPA